MGYIIGLKKNMSHTPENARNIASMLLGLASDIQSWEEEHNQQCANVKIREAEVEHKANCLNLMSDTLKTREIGVTEREKAVKKREDNMQDQTRVASNRLAIIKNLEAEIKDLKACRDKQRIAEAALRQCLGEKAELQEAFDVLEAKHNVVATLGLTQVSHELEAGVNEAIGREMQIEQELEHGANIRG